MGCLFIARFHRIAVDGEGSGLNNDLRRTRAPGYRLVHHTDRIDSRIDDETLEGIFNATGPQPVTNKVFMRAMRKVVGRPWSPPAPAFMVKPGARWILRTEASLALTGRKCYPRRFEEIGFTFAHTDLEATLRDVL